MNWTATVWALALNMRVALFWAAWNTAIQAMANTTVLMSNVIRLPQSWVIASKHRSTAKKAGPETARLFLWGCRSAQTSHIFIGPAPSQILAVKDKRPEVAIMSIRNRAWIGVTAGPDPQ